MTRDALSTDLAELAGLPYPAQLERIERLAPDPAMAGPLLDVLAALPDHEPLARAIVVMADRGVLADVADALGPLLCKLPDTGIQRVLRAVDRVTADDDARAALIGAVAFAVTTLPLDRIAAICLMDRWLKNTAPTRRAALIDDAVQRCRAAIAAADPEALPHALLVRLPGHLLASLDAEADAHGVGPRWTAVLRAFADRVLAVLQAAPRSLSQANAEDILARRVYTDPGHFLIELLQNAEDAGATTFEITVRDDAVEVWHDGAPFDARDVVGVLSIGQTTKATDQIGFFGVGFKSVYEVCERPQLYDRLFAFEIADVSIPRALTRPVDPRDGTRLVLPYRDPDDPARSPAQLHARALAVPPETLLTLRNVRRLRVARAPQTRLITALAGRHDAPGQIELHDAERGHTTRYQVASDTFTWDGPREAHRAASTRVLVALAANLEHGLQPLSTGAPTIFSHLPTAERSGLRLLVHAHFDLPVDRERLDLTAPWNRWALRCAGTLVARALAAFASTATLEALPTALDVLSLPAETTHDAFADLARTAAAAAADLPILPGADGRPLAPRLAALPDDPRLPDALPGHPVTPDGRRLTATLRGRRAAVALACGASTFGAAELLDLLERALAPDALPPAPWLTDALPALLDVLGDTLDPVPTARLARLHLLPDANHTPTAPRELHRTIPLLRPLYDGVRPLLHPELDHRPGRGQARLLTALGLATLGAADLVRDLHDPEFRDLLLQRGGPDALLDVARTFDPATVAPLARLPLFPTLARTTEPLDTKDISTTDPGPDPRRAATHVPLLHADRAPAAWLLPDDPELTDLLLTTPTDLRLLHPATTARLRPFLLAIGAHTLDLPHAVALLASGELALTGRDLASAWLDLLDRRADDLSPRLAHTLAHAPIFADHTSALRPLTGPDRALVPHDDAVTDFAPLAPWLAPSLRHRPALRRIPIPIVGPDDVLAALLLEGELVLLDPTEPDQLRRAYRYLARHAAPPSPATAERLARAPLWFDQHGDLHPLDALRRDPDDPTLASLYAAWGAGLFITTDALDVALRLGLADRIPPTDHRDLLAHLEARLADPDPDTAELARATLVRLLPGLEADLATRRLHPDRLNNLRLWPSRDRVLRAAHALVRPDALHRVLTDVATDALPPHTLLHDDARPHAEALRAVITFQSPARLLPDLLQAHARPNAPLVDQPPWLASTPLVLAFLRALAPTTSPDALADLPLVVDAHHHLVAGPRLHASPEELALLAPLPLTEQLADPDWAAAAAAIAPALAPPLLPRRLLTALLTIAPTAAPATEHPVLADPDQRQRLCAWLLTHADAIEADPQALGPLGNTPAILTADGTLQPPSQLLITDDDDLDDLRFALDADPAALNDLGLDAWRPAPEVPAALQRWLRRTFRLDDARARRLVAALAEAHLAAQSQQDAPRSARILNALAVVLLETAPDTAALQELIKRHKIHRLRVETDTGDFERPPKLLMPDPDHAHLLDAFMATPPPRVSTRYHSPATRALLLAAGASPRLDPERLAALLAAPDALASSTAATVALAHYLGALALDDPALVSRLRLAQLPWVPDGLGQRRRPSDLYWPALDVTTLIGHDPTRFPHPELVLALPASLAAPLGFRGLDDLDLDLVLQHAATTWAGKGVPHAVLDWLEHGLRQRRLPAPTIAATFRAHPLLTDDDGAPSLPDRLLGHPAPDLFGPDRAAWSNGLRRSKLAAALGVPQHPNAQRLAAYADELTARLDALGPDATLDRHPDLLDRLPRLLEALAAHDAPPLRRCPIAVLDPTGLASLTTADDPRVRLTDPDHDDHDAHLTPILPAQPDRALAWLHRCGVRTTAPASPTSPSTPPEPPPAAPGRPSDAPGLWRRVKRWFSDDDDNAPAPDAPGPSPRPSTPPDAPRPRAPRPPRPDHAPHAPRDQQDWFRPRDALNPQLHDSEDWVQRRSDSPEFGFAHTPTTLPTPWRYAPASIFGRFDPRTQRWLDTHLDPDLRAPRRRPVAQVDLHGRIPPGESVLPLPLYAKVLSVQGVEPIETIHTPSGSVVLLTPRATDLTARLELCRAPTFEAGGPNDTAPPHLLVHTVSDDELPPEALDAVEDLRSRPPFERALAIRDFIWDRYRYDPTYLEDAAVSHWLATVTRGRSNVHVAALHAGRDGKHLGRGVCYELNALACELLRRAGVPAAVATGWVFTRGAISEPDHLWAMALLPSDLGLRWLPLDASTTRDGRPLTVGAHPRGPWRARAERPQRLPREPDWARPGHDTPAPKPHTRRGDRLNDLVRLFRALEAAADRPPMPEAALRARVRAIMADPDALARLLDLLG